MFRFKRFVVRQERAAMKVGTDGVLLGAWCGPAPADRSNVHAESPEYSAAQCSMPGIGRALDIGTGTGLIALMIAQRSESDGFEIDAIEIDAESAHQARANADASPWAERIAIVHDSIQSFAQTSLHKYDLIVSNPPYFSRSLTCPDAARTTARHTESLSPAELARCAAALLSRRGRFAVILPHENAAGFIADAAAHSLALARRTDVLTTPTSRPKRAMLEFVQAETTRETTPEIAAGGGAAPAVEPHTIVIESDGRHGYSPEYVALTRDFYLKFP